ncbi:RagB/SusD family nutrient uptake outer membrane protein [Bacteroides reticulotermitis]|uniref:RagB/SusD family nutrient uptake outer membrane protein n=1 Tax=Bacteroides reticulotermitis TaxID=1133319 RepID=UPI003A8C3AC3
MTILTGCSDWLDVNPRSQIKSDILYETEDGYKKALNGVYIQIADEKLYGKNTSMYFTDALARLWTVPLATVDEEFNRIANFDYTHAKVESLISSIWQSYFTPVAQLNDMLANLEKEDGSKFKYNNEQLLKGEAIGLRAFLHLEVLRLFGPVPDLATDAEICIPYVTEMTNNPSKLVSKSWKEIVTAIEDDLTTAEEILEKFDPWVYNDLDSLNSDLFIGKGNVPVDDWQLYRQGRFNYLAALGTKARLYHWIGEKEKAVLYAKKVIEAKKITLVTAETFGTNKASLEMCREYLFGAFNPDLQQIVEPLFKSNKAKLTIGLYALDNMYESSTHTSDIRYAGKRYWEQKTYITGAIRHFYKYIGNDLVSAKNSVPLLRLAEVYFILIENLPLAEAKPYFVDFRVARSMNPSIDDSSVANETALLKRLEYEYRKEFYGEGQMFFFYKKHQYAKYTLPGTVILPSGVYVIPKPKGQTNFE